MFRKFFLVATLATSVRLFAQYQPGYASPGMPAGPSVVVVPASPSIYVVSGGLYGTGIYLTTPGTLPVQNTGISLAGREGISLETPLQTGAVTAVPSFSLGGVPINYTAPSYAGGETAVAESGRLINDMGPSYYASAATEGPPAPSLGEVAANYRSAHPRASRTFTNADAQRLANTVTIPGAAGMEKLPPAPPQ